MESQRAEREGLTKARRSLERATSHNTQKAELLIQQRTLVQVEGEAVIKETESLRKKNIEQDSLLTSITRAASELEAGRAELNREKSLQERLAGVEQQKRKAAEESLAFKDELLARRGLRRGSEGSRRREEGR